MPANKNALIRYKTIDNCLRNPYRRWTLQDLVDACSDALYEMEGIDKGVSVRTVQADIQLMRSDKLGYNAPIEVYEHKYYRYADRDYSITNMPISQNELDVMREAVDMLRELEDFDEFAEISDIVRRLQDKLATSGLRRKPIVHFDSVPTLKGIKLLNPLYNYISQQRSIRVMYQSFNARQPKEFHVCPYMLKEFRNRWFLFGGRTKSGDLLNLPLDRIVSIEPIDAPYRKNPDFDPEHFFDDVIGVSKDIGAPVRNVRFWANAAQSKYILTKPIHPSQKIIEQRPEDGSTIFQIKVVINFEMYSVFMSYGPGVRIISPRNAAAHMRSKTKDTARLYDSHIPFMPHSIPLDGCDTGESSQAQLQ